SEAPQGRDLPRPRGRCADPSDVATPGPRHRPRDRPPRVRRAAPRRPRPGAGDRALAGPRSDPGEGRGRLRSAGRPDLPRGGSPGRRAGDRGGPRRRLVRSPLRLPESRDPRAAAGGDRAHPDRRPHRRGRRRPRAIPAGRGPRAIEGGGPILIRPRAFAGLVLCAFLLGATWPVLGALPGEPVRIVAGDAYAITQGTGPLSINVSLA